MSKAKLRRITHTNVWVKKEKRREGESQAEDAVWLCFLHGKRCGRDNLSARSAGNGESVKHMRNNKKDRIFERIMGIAWQLTTSADTQQTHTKARDQNRASCSVRTMPTAWPSPRYWATLSNIESITFTSWRLKTEKLNYWLNYNYKFFSLLTATAHLIISIAVSLPFNCRQQRQSVTGNDRVVRQV